MKEVFRKLNNLILSPSIEGKKRERELPIPISEISETNSKKERRAEK